MLRPVGGRSVRVIVLQRLIIVLALVAEDAAKLFQLRRVGDQPVPIIVPDLVTKMPEQRAIQFAHLMPAPFALCVVGFGEIDGDHAVGVTGHDRRS